MNEMFLKKVLGKDFGELNIEELKVITSYDSVFSMSKKDIKVIDKVIQDEDLDRNRDLVIATLKEGLPNSGEILSRLDNYPIRESTIQLDFRSDLHHNLSKMDHKQLCIFIEKVLMMSDEFNIRFFRNEEYSLHEINGVVSISLGLTLVFEVFQKGKYKKFLELPYSFINKGKMVETLDSIFVRYFYILKIISEIVLSTDEDKLTKTKINKEIRDQITEYVKIIQKERKKSKQSGAKPKDTWTYVVCGVKDIEIEDDDEFLDWED